MPIILDRRAPEIGQRVSEYVLWLPESIRRYGIDRVVFDARTSSASKFRTPRYRRMLIADIQAIRAAGAKRISIVGHKRPYRGKLRFGRQDAIEGFERAADWGAILCFRDMSRLLRPDAYDPQDDQYAVWTPEELRDFLSLANGRVPLATILPPFLSPEEIHRQMTARGSELAASVGRLPGRRPKKLPKRFVQAVLLLKKFGLSERQIAKELGTTRSRVSRVLVRHGAAGNGEKNK
jgi:hypothetical protein